MYTYKGEKQLEKEQLINLENVNHSYQYKLIFEAEYDLEWISLHYGEDDYSPSAHSYFHSGPEHITIKVCLIEVYDGDNKVDILTIKDKDDFFTIIKSDLEIDANRKSC